MQEPVLGVTTTNYGAKDARTYAQVVKNTSGCQHQKWQCKNDTKMKVTQDKAWKGIEFNKRETNNEWLQNSMVGWVRDPERIVEVQKAMLVGRLMSLRVRYMGDNRLLISGEEGTKVIEFVEIIKNG